MALKEIGEEMNKQDNRATQFPLYVIQVDVRRYTEGEAEAEFMTRKEETDDLYLCDSCKEVYALDAMLPEECADCHWNAFDHFNIAREFDLRAGVFFTAKACEDHIKANYYHYENPKSFAVSAWRNYEMQEVMQFLSGLGGEVATFYR